MTCYIIPTAAAVVHYLVRTRRPSLKHNTHHLWLNLLFLGGAIFGVIDHLWNGELFLFGENLLLDLTLGVTITASIIVVWALIVVLDKSLARDIVQKPEFLQG